VTSGVTPEELRADMPAVADGDTVYLNTGASGPSPRRVVEAAEDALESHEFESPTEEGMYESAFDTFDRARAAVADHVGTGPGDVALTQSTTDGMGRVAAAMDWQPGDVVVRTDLEHPAGILPWRRLREEVGVEVRVVETEGGHVDADAFAAAVEDARLAAFSSVCWTTGTRLAVEDLVDVAHDAGARVLVDAVQSPGQRSVDVTAWGADAVAGAAHKWLLGPWGAGFLYVDPAFADELVPAQIGYMGVEDPDADPYQLTPGARRFEVGTTSPAPYAGLTEALAVIEELGYGTIRARIESLTDRLKAGLGDRLVGPRECESGLVAFEVADPETFVERAAAEGVVVRSLPTGTVRASLHAFNTPGDVDALLSVLADSR
jgi:selenocysteine lyase/cysteine desulfurase